MYITILFSEVLRSRIKSAFKSVTCIQEAFGSTMLYLCHCGRKDESLITKVLTLWTPWFFILETLKKFSGVSPFHFKPQRGNFPSLQWKATLQKSVNKSCDVPWSSSTFRTVRVCMRIKSRFPWYMQETHSMQRTPPKIRNTFSFIKTQ